MQTKVYYKLSLFSLKRSVSQTLKVAAAKKSFLSVFIIDTTCFDELFSFHVITANSIFTQIYRYQEASSNRHVAAFFQTSVLKKKSAFYIHDLRNNITTMLI